jgi:hypothetical protein
MASAPSPSPRRLMSMRSSRQLYALSRTPVWKPTSSFFTDEARQAGRKARTARSLARATNLAPTIRTLQASGVTTLRGIAAALNEANIPTPRGVGRGSRLTPRGCWRGLRVRCVDSRRAKSSCHPLVARLLTAEHPCRPDPSHENVEDRGKQ